jgi:hypothetical protein
VVVVVSNGGEPVSNVRGAMDGGGRRGRRRDLRRGVCGAH